MEYGQVVPMIRRDVIAQHGGDIRIMSEIELNVNRFVYNGSCNVMRRAVDFTGSVKQSGIVPFCLKFFDFC